jgi:O-antigen biosynthesis protein
LENADVTIGLIVQPEQDGYLETTLNSLLINTDYPSRLILIGDGIDIGKYGCVEALEQKVIVICNPYCSGFATCSNIVLEKTDTPYLVLLHSGTYVGPSWLSQLIGVLRSNCSHGMTGPSTNIAWNQQRMVDYPQGTPSEIDAYARRLHSKYGGNIQYLDETHSLCDFCYCFKREIVYKIGYFDEGYERGPCYEIDFSTRAARAGYKCVWVRGAYVHRFPTPPYIAGREMRFFNIAKKKYQSKFCGLKLGLEGNCACNFEHCLGEACKFFAPQNLIKTFVEKQSGLLSSIDTPLVSCIMPTKNRRNFVTQAIKYFIRQDYPNKELVIVDDGQDKVRDFVPQDDRIRYFETNNKGLSVGELRNMAVAESQGQIIAHWDDDDWYGDTRLSYQVKPLLRGDADLSGLNGRVYYDLYEDQFWFIESWLHTQIINLDIHAGTILYRRNIWENITKFQPIYCGEDAIFVNEVFRSGAKVLDMPDHDNFIYIRHDTNTWKVPCGKYGHPSGWRRIMLPKFMQADDVSFYRSINRR